MNATSNKSIFVQKQLNLLSNVFSFKGNDMYVFFLLLFSFQCFRGMCHIINLWFKLTLHISCIKFMQKFKLFFLMETVNVVYFTWQPKTIIQFRGEMGGLAGGGGREGGILNGRCIVLFCIYVHQTLKVVHIQPLYQKLPVMLT